MKYDSKQKILIENYEKLSPFEQTLLQLCAVMYAPRNRTAILKSFKRTGFSFPEEPFTKVGQLTPYLKKLEKLNLLDEEFRCNPHFMNTLVRFAIAEGHYQRMVDAVQGEVPLRNIRYVEGEDCPVLMRDFQIAIHTGDADRCRILYNQMVNSRICKYLLYKDHHYKDPYLQVCNTPFDAEWFATLPVEVQTDALAVILSHKLESLEPMDDVLAAALVPGFFDRISAHEKQGLGYLVTSILIFSGRLKEAGDLIGKIVENNGYSSGLLGWLHFIKGRQQEALESYEKDLKTYRKMAGKRTAYFTGIGGVFYILALLKSHAPSSLELAAGLIKKAKTNEYKSRHTVSIYYALEAIVDIENGELQRAKKTISAEHSYGSPLSTFFWTFASYWLNSNLSVKEFNALDRIFCDGKKAGLMWLAMECAEVLCRSTKKGKKAYRNFADKIREKSGAVPIISMVKTEEPWQKSLRALIDKSDPQEKAEARYGNTRLVWLISYKYNNFDLQAKEQKQSDKGIWSKGRPVAMSRLYSGKNLKYITAQDRKICDTIVSEYRYYGGTNYYFDMDKTLPVLIGHPLLFLADDPSTPVELVKGEPEVSVKKSGTSLNIKFVQKVSDDRFIVVPQGPSRFQVIEITEEHRRIAGILGGKGLSIPLHAKDQVLAAMAAISSSVTVHSSIGGASEDIAEKKGDTMPYVRILPSGGGFRVEVIVKPLGEGGPHLKPGIGDKTIIARVAGKRIQTQRNLGIEEKMARAVEAACPSLPIFDEIDRTGYLAGPEDCLQVLTELKKLQDDGRVVVEWPEGEKLKVVEEISFDRLRMGIKSRNNWFEVSGELKVDENLVLDMKKLLDLVGQTEHRFIPLDDGRFIALTEVFRRKLAEMETLSHGRGESLRFSPLSALLLEEFADNIPKLKSDKAWKEKVKRIREGRDLIPEIPSTFKGELRAYQIDGYRWLMRLAHWGVGACLADDMGLGKTVQALAVILARACEGPALVVAPTSVCSNWMDEAKRFAPTLNPVLFGGTNREEVIKNLKGFDLLVVSYTLLQQEANLLTGVNWHTVVLDEAQAIKNITTCRSRAAMELNGDFRIITTGTPIENNLTEFWTLFNFVNPGLLGPLKRFNERFVIPIERDNSADARRRLKKMISPFILRRIKSQVLDELPPRTDVILEVEMGREEKAFYEALRQEAVKKLEDDETPPERKHFKILAEIMKLRRACCHPTLVMPECGLSGAKLDLFGNLVAELRGNGHKALVFSQFVGHLNILREYLEDQKIDYRYIDGSTPAKERKKQVDRFQAGEGDIFLISLKAGGLGLNLTAASYVIHMDPWWNPAVEDQASDRAYRIGQQQPVTVYRLVMRGAIEEKIVRLHAKKRDLADSLLAGSDMSGKISAEELLELIRET